MSALASGSVTEIASTDLLFRPMEATESDLRLFSDCFSANQSPRSMELLRWQYFFPPANRLLVNLALTPSSDQQRVAAIYAVFPIWMRAAGARVLGVQSLNTLTDEAFRGKGLFLHMANALYRRCGNEGVQFVYGFPNGNSAHGFFNRLGWKPFDPMPFMLRPLRSEYLLRKVGAGSTLAKIFDIPLILARSPKLRGRLTLHTIKKVGPELDGIWRGFATAIGFAVERDAEYLSWRLRRPGETYESIALLEGDRPVGLVIVGTNRAENGGTVGKLMELMFLPGQEEVGDLLVAEALYRLNVNGCGAVWAWNFAHSPNHSSLRRAGFIPLSPKWHTTELHVGARALNPSLEIGERRNWYVSLLDSDTD